MASFNVFCSRAKFFILSGTLYGLELMKVASVSDPISASPVILNKGSLSVVGMLET